MSVCSTGIWCAVSVDQEWWDVSSSGATRSWPEDGAAPLPWKRGPKASIRDLLDSPKFVLIDLAHSYAISGFGKDQLASCIIFIAVHCALWGKMPFEKQLERAFDSFSGWCSTNKKTSTIHEFSKKELKITSLPGLMGGCCVFSMFVCRPLLRNPGSGTIHGALEKVLIRLWLALG